MPVKMIIHSEKRLDAAAGMNDVVLEMLAAEMHVREKIEQNGVVGKSAVDFDAIIVGAGRNDKGVIGELKAENALRGRRLGEDEAEAGLIGGGVAVRRVVHLENEVGAARDEFGDAVGPEIGGAAGGVDQ